MIFNRLTGLDLGPPPSLIIADNIKMADAPVRYPFLWNAPIQDQTQWPGFADNGSDVLALSRNLGEVFGVFGVFQPKHDEFGLLDSVSGLLQAGRQPPRQPAAVEAVSPIQSDFLERAGEVGLEVAMVPRHRQVAG